MKKYILSQAALQSFLKPISIRYRSIPQEGYLLPDIRWGLLQVYIAGGILILAVAGNYPETFWRYDPSGERGKKRFDT